MLNHDQTTGLLRAIVPAVVAYLAALGLPVTESGVNEFLAVAVTLGSAAWSIYSNRSGKVIK